MNVRRSEFSIIKRKYLKFIKSQEIPNEPFRDKLKQLNKFYIPICDMIYKNKFMSVFHGNGIIRIISIHFQ